MEPLIMRCPEDAHHPGRSGRPDQHRDHPFVRLGRLTASGGPQAADAHLARPAQRHRVPEVSATYRHTSKWAWPNCRI